MQSSHWCEGLVALECSRGHRRWAGEEGVKVLIWRDRAVLFLIKKVVWVLAVITCLSTGILRNKIYFRTCCFRWAGLAWWKLRVVMLYKNQSYAPDTCTPNCTPNLLLTAVGMIKLVIKTFVPSQDWYICMNALKKDVIHRYLVSYSFIFGKKVQSWVSIINGICLLWVVL